VGANDRSAFSLCQAVTEWTAAAAHLSNYTREEALGKQLFQEFVAADAAPEVSPALAQAIQGIKTATVSYGGVQAGRTC